MPTEEEEERISWNWNYRWLSATLQVLGFFWARGGVFILYMWVYCSYLQTHQKRASESITDGCEPSCGCWELNSGPLEEQSVLLRAEPSLQPWKLVLRWEFDILAIRELQERDLATGVWEKRNKKASEEETDLSLEPKWRRWHLEERWALPVNQSVGLGWAYRHTEVCG